MRVSDGNLYTNYRKNREAGDSMLVSFLGALQESDEWIQKQALRVVIGHSRTVENISAAEGILSKCLLSKLGPSRHKDGIVPVESFQGESRISVSSASEPDQDQADGAQKPEFLPTAYDPAVRLELVLPRKREEKKTGGYFKDVDIKKRAHLSDHDKKERAVKIISRAAAPKPKPSFISTFKEAAYPPLVAAKDKLVATKDRIVEAASSAVSASSSLVSSARSSVNNFVNDIFGAVDDTLEEFTEISTPHEDYHIAKPGDLPVIEEEEKIENLDEGEGEEPQVIGDAEVVPHPTNQGDFFTMIEFTTFDIHGIKTKRALQLTALKEPHRIKGQKSRQIKIPKIEDYSHEAYKMVNISAIDVKYDSEKYTFFESYDGL